MVSKKSSTKPIIKKLFEDLVFFVVDYPWNHSMINFDSESMINQIFMSNLFESEW